MMAGEQQGSEPSAETLRAIYQEICASHNGIADFRAKLLALLPIASGVGIFLLIDKSTGGRPDFNVKFLVPVGLFGFVVTFGLFMYELRGIQDCVLLRARAGAIEKTLGVAVAGSQFRRRPEAQFGGLADEIGAGWIVYMAVMAGWVFVAAAGAFGAGGLMEAKRDLWLTPVAAVLGVAYLLVLALSPPGKTARRKLADGWTAKRKRRTESRPAHTS
jgi:hypothetical protein